jgi:hypothetical protein
MTRFSPQAEETLREAGWYPGRQVPALVASWKKILMLSDGVEMFSSAESVLLEFGGLRINQQSPGVSSAREPFTFDPTSAVYEGDRFSDFSTILQSRLYPLGEASAGYYFWAIGENGSVYLLMNDLRLLGTTIEGALEKLLIGLEAEKIA